MTLRHLLWAAAAVSALLLAALWAMTPSCQGLSERACYMVIQ